MLSTYEPSRPRPSRSRRRPAPASDAARVRPGGRGASSTRSTSESRAGRRTARPSSSPRRGLPRGPRTRVESPPFSPDAQFHVGLAQRRRELVDLSLHLGLAFASRRPRVLPPRQRLVCPVEELLLPLRDRRLAHLQTTRSLDLSHLTAQHGEDDLDLFVRRTERLPAHLTDPLRPSKHHTWMCPGKSDPRHTAYTYDEGAPNNDIGPTGGPYRLATTTTTSAQTPDGVDNDTKTTKTGYAPVNADDVSGWDLGQPTTSTTVMSGGAANIVTTTRYDPQGRTIETRMPSNTGGGTAGATLTSYYTATGSGGCVNAAEAGLVCQTQPAATTAGAGLPGLPVTTTSY